MRMAHTLKKYETTDYSPVTEKVQQLFEGIHIPTKEDWTSLKEQVQKNGLYNSYRLAIAPTQSISYVQNATSSVMPIVSQIESRTYANATNILSNAVFIKRYVLVL